jgi:hypothetical protein
METIVTWYEVQYHHQICRRTGGSDELSSGNKGVAPFQIAFEKISAEFRYY